MQLCLIAALNPKRVIGFQGKMPWHVPEDLKRFKALTMGSPVIMGRRTFESIGKALPHRRNLVVSRTFSEERARELNLELCCSLEEALERVKESDKVFVIGGFAMYEEALPRASCLYLTEIDKDCEGDTFFPEFKVGEGGFREVRRESFVSAREGLHCAFVDYERA